jgi:serine/threonine protein kinase/DNA-binding XRE family transcriptional regulator
MSDHASFGYLVRRLRKALDLTQDDLARQVGCAVVTIRKIEADERRPSTIVARRLAECLAIPLDQRDLFTRAARMALDDAEMAQLAGPPWPPIARPHSQRASLARKGYDLGQRIGSGGFGEVYIARQQSVGRDVAVKIILPHYASHPDFIQRFEAEAQLVAQLEHPQIVPLYDYWREQADAALVMRYISGGSLRDTLVGGPVAIGEVARLLEQIVAALTFAHQHDVVHRDLKPANILLDQERNAYLADFGIAKHLGTARADDRTLPGALVGSLAYLAPEQIQGEAATPRADIYSLGIVLYELLVGEHPFAESSPAELLHRQLNQPLPSLRARRPDLPARLDDVLQTATAKHPGNRYADALSLLAGFQQALAAPARAIAVGAPNRSTTHYIFLDKGHPADYRRDEARALAQAIRARENRLVIGLPGMGVSNLLRFLVSRSDVFDQNVVFAYVDCDTLTEDADLDALWAAIAEQLREQQLGAPAASEPSYEQLRRMVMQIGGDPTGRLVIVIDQADRLLAAAGRSFYQRLKALTDLNKRVCCVVAASPIVAERVDPEDLLFAGRRLWVGRLNQRDCSGAILEEERRLGLTFDPVARARLADLTGGHPGLLRAVSSAAAAGALDGVEATDQAADHLLARDDVRYRCRKLWDAIPPVQQAALTQMAVGKASAVAEETKDWLQRCGLVEQREATPQFCSAILRRFAAAQPPEASAGDRLAPILIAQPTLDQDGCIIAGKVFKGEQEVSVSRLVLRLIACLIRERKIYTKKDVKLYVWGKSEEDEGITNNALDDLIREARERLGKQYIKTHRGQGYELIG